MLNNPCPRQCHAVALRDTPTFGGPEAQRGVLVAAGCEQVFIDTTSGRLARHPELDKALLAATRTGEQLVATDGDALSRVKAREDQTPSRTASVSRAFGHTREEMVRYTSTARCRLPRTEVLSFWPAAGYRSQRPYRRWSMPVQ